MKLLEVSRTKFGPIVVPGGWSARIPSIGIERNDERFGEIVEIFRRSGASTLHAEKLAIGVCQDLFSGSWTSKLKMFVGNAARLYVESFGDLEGFDPEVVQAAYIPSADRLISRGKTNFVLREVFTQMRGTRT